LAGVYLLRLHLVHTRGFVIVTFGAILLIALNGLYQAIRRIPLDRAALAIDRSHALHDRLRSALSFSADPAATEFMRAAIADAERAADGVDVARAAPLSRPHALGPAAIVAAVAAVVALLHFPTRAAMVTRRPRPPRLV